MSRYNEIRAEVASLWPAGRLMTTNEDLILNILAAVVDPYTKMFLDVAPLRLEPGDILVVRSQVPLTTAVLVDDKVDSQVMRPKDEVDNLFARIAALEALMEP